MFTQAVKGGNVSWNPRYGVWENCKKEEGRYGGGIEPRFKCGVKGDWNMVNGEWGVGDLRFTIGKREERLKRLDFLIFFQTNTWVVLWSEGI